MCSGIPEIRAREISTNRGDHGGFARVSVLLAPATAGTFSALLAIFSDDRLPVE
jgi:hypothetical protein